MENRVINDLQIREYLLGRLEGDPELVEQIDEQILTDAQISIIVDVVEDEIMEEYIEGSLCADDLQSVERHFLRPPERQRKLRNARLLNQHLAMTSLERERLEQLDTQRGLLLSWTRVLKVPHFRTYAEFAVAAVFVVAIAFLVYQRRELGMAVNRTNQQLSEERQKEIALNQQVQPKLQTLTPSTSELHLFEAGITRGKGQLPTVNLSNASGTLHIEVAISSDLTDKVRPSAGKYQVQLKRLGQKTIFWSRDSVDPLFVPGGAILRLDLPEGILPIGICELVAKQPGKTALSYSFIVSDAR